MKNSLLEEGSMIAEKREAAEGGARRAGVLTAAAGVRGAEGAGRYPDGRAGRCDRHGGRR